MMEGVMGSTTRSPTLFPPVKNYWKTYFGPGGAAVGGTEKAGIGADV